MLAGKELLDTFLKLAPYLPMIMGMEDSAIIWATDTEKYTYVMAPPPKDEWRNLALKAGEKIKSGVGPVVLKTKQPYHGVISSEVFGIPLRASAYPLIEGDEVIGVVGISFGITTEDTVAKLSTDLANLCMKLKYK